jgi:hypothetical protein
MHCTSTFQFWLQSKKSKGHEKILEIFHWPQLHFPKATILIFTDLFRRHVDKTLF